MTALKPSCEQSRLRRIVTAFAIWFVHFMVLWAAGEIWPHQWTANALAWGATAIALVALSIHYGQSKTQQGDEGFSGWSYRIERGTVLFTMVAVVFSALPSVAFLPRLA